MNFKLIKPMTARLLIVASFCFLLCNCGNKKALFLEPVVTDENQKANDKDQMLNSVDFKSLEENQTRDNFSEKAAASKGEKKP